MGFAGEMELIMPRLSIILIFTVLTVSCSTEELTLSINFKRPISVTNEKFLSFTLDPATLLHTSDALGVNFERSTNLARALAPAYLRLAGPTSNSHGSKGTSDSQQDDDKNNIFSESNWSAAYRWADESGLDLIACISPERAKRSADFDSLKNFISFNDRMGYNTSWQLGYECQTRCNVSGSELGDQVAKLRKLLDDYPRYFESIITGPDVVTYETKKQREYLRNYLTAAVPALSAITWHPDFARMKYNDKEITMRIDKLAADKEELYKVIGNFVTDQPLWIAESRDEKGKDKFQGALVWASRLGAAAAANVDVIMRQPSNLIRPTPDYWVSLLYKQLVGREVFDVKFHSGFESRIHFWCHCTKPGAVNEKGSATIFGVNLTPDNVVVDLKGFKITTAHQYILSPGIDSPRRMFSEDVLLNNESLALINDIYVPRIKPEVLVDRRGLNLQLPPKGIGFWVLTELKPRSCVESEEYARPGRIKRRRDTVRQQQPEEENNDEPRMSGSSTSQKNIVKSRTKHRGEQTGNGEPRSKRKDSRRELNRLKKFLEKKVEYYQERRIPVASKSSEAVYEYNRFIDQKSLEDMQSRLKTHRNRLLETQNQPSLNEDPYVENSNVGRDQRDDVVPRAVTLISKIERGLEEMKQQPAAKTKRMALPPKVKNRLKSLYELLKRANLPEVNDSNNPLEFQGRRKRSRRSVLIDGEDQLTVKRDTPRTRLRTEVSRDRRNDRKLKRKDGTRSEVEPSPLERRATDSGEDNFYGFFRKAPAKDFPEGDVFLSTGNASEDKDYDYVNEGGSIESKEETTTNSRATGAEDIWVDENNDDPGYTPNEFFENVKLTNYPAKENSEDNAELSEVEQPEQEYEDRGGMDPSSEEVPRIIDEKSRQRARYFVELENPSSQRASMAGPRVVNARSSIKGRQHARSILANQQTVTPKITRPRISQLARALLTNYKNERASAQQKRQYSVNADFSTMDYATERQRTKRNDNDLNAILNQEMIEEDQGNSRDCKCRVIRKLSGIPDRERRQAEENQRIGEYKEYIVQDGISPYLVGPIEPIDSSSPNEEVMEPETSVPLDPNTGPSVIETAENANSKIQIAVASHLDKQSDDQIEPGPTEGNIYKLTEAEEKPAMLAMESATDSLIFQEDAASQPIYMDNPRNVRQLDPNKSESNTFLTLDALEKSDQRDRTQFFRESPAEDAQEKTTINPVADIQRSTSSVPQYVATAAGQETIFRTPIAGSVEIANPENSQVVPGPDSRRGTTEKITLREEEGSERRKEDREREGEREGERDRENYDSDQLTSGLTTRNVKRQTMPEETTPIQITVGIPTEKPHPKVGSRLEIPKSTKSSLPVNHVPKMRVRPHSKPDDIAKTREVRLQARTTKPVLTLGKDNSSKKSKRIMRIPLKSASQENDKNYEYQKRRAEQIEKLRSKLRGKRERMLQQYEKDILDIVDKIEDEETRNLKRREALEKLKTDDDFRDMIEREKLAYVLMYNPAEYSLTKRDDYKTEPRNKKLIPDDYMRFAPPGYGYLNDPRVLQFMNPYLSASRSRMYQVPRKENGNRHNDVDRKGNIVHYVPIDRSGIHRGRNIQKETSSRNCKNGKNCKKHPNKRHRQVYDSDYFDSIEDVDASREVQRRSSPQRKIYIIDPSSYRGGEPILESHEHPLQSSVEVYSGTSGEDYAYDISYVEPYDSSKYPPVFTPEEEVARKKLYFLDVSPSESSSGKYNKEEMLGVVLNPEDGRNTDQSTTSRSIKEINVPSNKVRNSETNLPGDTLEEKSLGNGSSNIATKRNSNTKRVTKEVSSEVNITKNSAEETKNSQAILIPVESRATNLTEARVQNHDKNLVKESSLAIPLTKEQAKSRSKRSTESETKRKKPKRLSPPLLRNKFANRKRSGRSKYLCLRQDSGETSEESPSNLYKLIKEEDHYEAVPVKMSRTKQKKLLAKESTESGSLPEEIPREAKEDEVSSRGKTFDDYIRLMMSDNSESGSSAESDSPEYLHIFVPSLSQNDYSPMRIQRDFTREAKDVHFHEQFTEKTFPRESSESVDSKEHSSRVSTQVEFGAENFSSESDQREGKENLNEKSVELVARPQYADETDYEFNSSSAESSQGSSELEDAIVSDKYGILMVVPYKRGKPGRIRRDLSQQDQHAHNKNEHQMSLTESRKQSFKPEDYRAPNKIDGTDHFAMKKKNFTKYLERKKQKKNSEEVEATSVGSPLEKIARKIENATVDGLEKTRNFTESVAKLIKNIEPVQVKSSETEKVQNEKSSNKNYTRGIFQTMMLKVQRLYTFLRGMMSQPL